MFDDTRIAAARAALARAAWVRRDAPAYHEDAVTSLLADIRHLCAASGIDFGRCNHLAWAWYQDETRSAS